MKLRHILPALALLALAPLALSAAESDTTPSTPAAKAKAPYPLEVCAVSGEALGSMGDPYIHMHKEEGKPDREVRLCCKGCLKKFNKEPAKYLSRIDAAKKAADGKPAAPAADAHAGHSH